MNESTYVYSWRNNRACRSAGRNLPTPPPNQPWRARAACGVHGSYRLKSREKYKRLVKIISLLTIGQANEEAKSQHARRAPLPCLLPVWLACFPATPPAAAAGRPAGRPAPARPRRPRQADPVRVDLCLLKFQVVERPLVTTVINRPPSPPILALSRCLT